MHGSEIDSVIDLFLYRLDTVTVILQDVRCL